MAARIGLHRGIDEAAVGGAQRDRLTHDRCPGGIPHFENHRERRALTHHAALARAGDESGAGGGRATLWPRRCNRDGRRRSDRDGQLDRHGSVEGRRARAAHDTELDRAGRAPRGEPEQGDAAIVRHRFSVGRGAAPAAPQHQMSARHAGRAALQGDADGSRAAHGRGDARGQWHRDEPQRSGGGRWFHRRRRRGRARRRDWGPRDGGGASIARVDPGEQHGIGAQGGEIVPVARGRRERQTVALHQRGDLGRRHRAPREQPDQVGLAKRLGILSGGGGPCCADRDQATQRQQTLLHGRAHPERSK